MAYIASLAVPAGKVASTLTNFVVRVDLAHMPAGWWADTSTDLGNVRVKSAGTVIPFDIVGYDRTAKTGELFFKSTLTTASATFTVETVNGATALAATDPNGRKAVWSDYEIVLVGSLVNRSGIAPDATLQSGTLGTPALSGWIAPNASAVIESHGVAAFSAWSYGVSFYRRSTSAGTLVGYSADTSATIEVLYPRTGTTPTLYNSSDANLIGTATVADATRHRAHGLHNGTVDRKLYVDGALVGTDTGAAARPGAGGNTFHLGSANDTPTNWDLNYAYLRNGILSDDWLSAEYASWETPASFYAVTDSGPGTVSGTLSTAAPAARVDLSDKTSGVVDATAPAASMDAVGEVAQSGALSVTAPRASVSLDGAVDSTAAGPFAVTAPAARVSIAGNTSAIIQTDTSNDYDGRLRDGLALVSTSVAVTLPTNRGQRVDKAIAYPTPTLVDGRPT